MKNEKKNYLTPQCELLWVPTEDMLADSPAMPDTDKDNETNFGDLLN